MGFSGAAAFLFVSGEPVPEALSLIVAFLCGSYFGAKAATPAVPEEPALERPLVPGVEEVSLG